VVNNVLVDEQSLVIVRTISARANGGAWRGRPLALTEFIQSLP
jgi:hypothetical protein